MERSGNMVQQSNYLKIKDEAELNALLDKFYDLSKKNNSSNKKFGFKGLLEIISSPVVIMTAIHNIKSNRGSKTPGVDKVGINDVLQLPFERVIEIIQSNLYDYHPKKLKRVYIEKPGKKEKRPLGIPTIWDRIIQECVRIVLDPIVEARFFNHSYGYRPQRDAEQAIARIAHLAHATKNHWVIEGDITKFFENVDHRILTKQLWNMGIHDKRVLEIIKQMLKAGVMGESNITNLGTPQGGIISPLLANVYLTALDRYIANAWEDKNTQHDYKSVDARRLALRKSRLIPCFFIRYADDWVLFTDSKEHAEIWKDKIEYFLENKLKLSLSKEKTKITNIRKNPIHFLGFTYKLERGKSKSGYVSSIKPDEEKIKRKIAEIKKAIRRIRSSPNENERAYQVFKVNSMIRGLINYYSIATGISRMFNKYAWRLKQNAIYEVIQKRGGELVEANKVDNLTELHKNYKTKIPAMKINGKLIGVTSLSFCQWKQGKMKNQEETPYTPKGRHMYRERSLSRPLIEREDAIMSENLIFIILHEKNIRKRKDINFEYMLNKAYAFNRDKGKCKICGRKLDAVNLRTHHINNKLPLNLINKVANLASTCDECHEYVHSDCDKPVLLKQQAWNKIIKYREKLV